MRAFLGITALSGPQAAGAWSAGAMGGPIRAKILSIMLDDCHPDAIQMSWPALDEETPRWRHRVEGLAFETAAGQCAIGAPSRSFTKTSCYCQEFGHKAIAAEEGDFFSKSLRCHHCHRGKGQSAEPGGRIR